MPNIKPISDLRNYTEALKDLQNIKENIITEFEDIAAKKVITEITSKIRSISVIRN